MDIDAHILRRVAAWNGISQRRLAPRPKVLFGHFATWDRHIRRRLDASRYAATFADLGDENLAAFDAVVPLSLEHYGVMARNPALRGVKFLHPDAAVVDLCDDKRAFMRFLDEAGLAAFALAVRSPGPPYPYVWKRRHGADGRHCVVVRDRDDERGLDLDDPEWFAQAFAHGECEFAAHVLRQGGVTRYASTVAYRMSGPDRVRGWAEAPRVKRFALGCAHLDVLDSILDRLGYEGAACFNYKLCDGKPVIFELNPRFGGSLARDINRFLAVYLAALGG